MATKEMRMFILKKEVPNNFSDFVSFWAKAYSYPNMDNYVNNIDSASFEYKSLKELFEWKNGMKLSGNKQKSFDKIAEEIKLINDLKNGFKQNEFDAHFGKISTVWRVFLMHSIQPDRFPIYDQHTHRAYCYLHGQDFKSINNKISNKRKTAFYFDTYLPFVESQKEEINKRELDKALFAFGKFLKQPENAHFLIS